MSYEEIWIEEPSREQQSREEAEAWMDRFEAETAERTALIAASCMVTTLPHLVSASGAAGITAKSDIYSANLTRALIRRFPAGWLRLGLLSDVEKYGPFPRGTPDHDWLTCLLDYCRGVDHLTLVLISDAPDLLDSFDWMYRDGWRKAREGCEVLETLPQP